MDSNRKLVTYRRMKKRHAKKFLHKARKAGRCVFMVGRAVGEFQ